MLAPLALNLGIPPSFLPSADHDVLSSGIENVEQFITVPFVIALHIVACALHTQSFPSSFLPLPDLLTLRCMLLRHGR